MVAVDADTNAFNAFMDARRLPDATPDQKAARQAAMQAGLKVAIDVPLETAKASFAALELAGEASRLGKVASITDAAVGAQMAYAGVRGGIWNVVINLKDITDEAYVAGMQRECSSLLTQAGERLGEITAYIDQKLLDRLAKARKS